MATPPTHYLGLSSTNPAIAATEPSGNGYARVAVLDSFWGSGNNRVSLAASSGDWLSGVVLGYYAIFDALSGGNLVAYGVFSTAFPVHASRQPDIIINGNPIPSGPARPASLFVHPTFIGPDDDFVRDSTLSVEVVEG
jgi:hypothetical protein